MKSRRFFFPKERKRNFEIFRQSNTSRGVSKLFRAFLMFPLVCFSIFSSANEIVSKFMDGKISIASLATDTQGFENVVLEQVDGYTFQVIDFTEMGEKKENTASNYDDGELSIKYLKAGGTLYSNVKFSVSADQKLSLVSFYGPHQSLSFAASSFQLREPETWETSTISFDQNAQEYSGRSAYWLGSLPLLDVDRDGLKDILLPGTLQDKDGWVDEKFPILWLRNVGDTTFEAGDRSVIPATAARIHHGKSFVADFNNDGMDDFASLGGGLDKPPFSGEPNLLLLSNPDGAFTDSGQDTAAFGFKGFTHDMAIGDVNNDGYVDIALAEIGGTDLFRTGQSIRVLANDGSGNFADYGAFTNGADFASTTLALAFADFNGDNYDDLVIGAHFSPDNSAINRVSDRIYLNDGNGFFDPESYISLPVFVPPWGDSLVDTLSILVADFDDDGLLDLVIQKQKDYQIGLVQFIKALPDGSFNDVTSFYSPLKDYQEKWAKNIKMIDVNNDGYGDLVFERESEGDPIDIFNHVWLSEAGDGFKEFSNFKANIGDGWFWYIDLDDDGDVDLLRRKSSLFPTKENGVFDKRFEWSVFENQTVEKRTAL